jgi:hypothetical protein
MFGRRGGLCVIGTTAGLASASSSQLVSGDLETAQRRVGLQVLGIARGRALDRGRPINGTGFQIGACRALIHADRDLANATAS